MWHNNHIIPNTREDHDIFWSLLRQNVDINDNFQHYLFFKEIENYFLGLYSVEGDENSAFMPYVKGFLFYLFRYGQLFVKKIKNQYFFFQIEKIVYRSILPDIIHCREITPNNYHLYNSYNKTVIFKNYVDGVYVKWEAEPMAAIVKFWAITKMQSKFYKIFENQALLDNKKIIYKINNDSVAIADEELKSYFDVNTPFIKQINPLSLDEMKATNLMEPLNIGESHALKAYNNLQNFRTFWKDIFGMVTSTDNKKERKNLVESIGENVNSENAENNTISYLVDFSRDLFALYGDIIVFKENINLTGENNDSINNVLNQESEFNATN